MKQHGNHTNDENRCGRLRASFSHTRDLFAQRAFDGAVQDLAEFRTFIEEFTHE